jgi:PEP-CTERM putative exosortase interaction domain
MTNHYRNVVNIAVASVCTAVGLVLEVSEPVKAAIFTFAPAITFEVIDLDQGNSKFDGQGDLVFPNIFFASNKGTFGESENFAEFNLGNFFFDSNTTINRAVFQTQLSSLLVTGLGIENPTNPGSLGIFGYVGNGTADASDFGAGVFLSSVDISLSSPGDILNFDVTPFVNQQVGNGDAFAGFGIRALNLGAITLNEGPKLIVETTEPVPEPTTILGSITGLGIAGLLKRKKFKLAK